MHLRHQEELRRIRGRSTVSARGISTRVACCHVRAFSKGDAVGETGGDTTRRGKTGNRVRVHEHSNT